MRFTRMDIGITQTLTIAATAILPMFSHLLSEFRYPSNFNRENLPFFKLWRQKKFCFSMLNSALRSRLDARVRADVATLFFYSQTDANDAFRFVLVVWYWVSPTRQNDSFLLLVCVWTSSKKHYPTKLKLLNRDVKG